jgi:DedD protein
VNSSSIRLERTLLKPALRERLLGALVFLCLGLIFYPVVFDTRDEFVVDRESQIPSQLVRVSPMTLEDPIIPEDAKPPPRAEEVFVPKETSLASGAGQSPILDSNGIPEAWVLQIGSFSAQQNAQAVEQKLLAAGFHAYQRQTAATGQTPLYRVLVGPYLDRTIAQTDLSMIEQMGMNRPLLLEFSP